MRIAFHSVHLGMRGTEVALYDYALGAREILGHEPVFLLPHRPQIQQNPVYQRFAAALSCHLYQDVSQRETLLRDLDCDLFYCIKNGWDDGVASREVPTGVHAIFMEGAFHGDIYAYVSPWLSQVMSYGRAPWVPHIVDLPRDTGDLRHELGLTPEAVVFGRYGGPETFDLPFGTGPWWRLPGSGPKSSSCS